MWTRPKAEITDEQYREFYHHVAHAFDEPFARVHFTAEGALSYAALLFVPSQRPFDLFDPKRRHGVKLYVRRVFITQELEGLFPRYLRFVSGVVDSEDLQLNVSRETLQHGAVVARMRKALVKRVLDELAAKAKAEPAAEVLEEGKAKPVSYLEWWAEFGGVLKEGVYEDAENRERLLELARFRSTHGPGWTSLAEYVGRMKEGQDAIYYISGESHEALRTSPQLEQALAKGVEVLLLDDPVDEFWIPEAKDFKGKAFRSLTRGDVDLSGLKGEAKEEQPEPKVAEDALKRLVARLKVALGEEVSDVRPSKRLKDSAVCLVAEEQGHRPAARALPQAAQPGQGAEQARARGEPAARADPQDGRAGEGHRQGPGVRRAGAAAARPGAHHRGRADPRPGRVLAPHVELPRRGLAA